jgi:putative transposase
LQVPQGKIELYFLQPGTPDQNPLNDCSNRTYRGEALLAHLLDSLEQLREMTESWIPEHTEERPHDSLGSVPPLTFGNNYGQSQLQ